MKQKFDYETCAKGGIELISKYFKNKVDKGGQPYIGHLRRVAEKVDKIVNEKYQYSSIRLSDNYNKAVLVAYLHDILEDTDCTVPELEDIGCDKEIIDAILAITRSVNEDKYFDFIKRVKKNPIARIVKIADLEDNMDITRLNKFGEYEQKRLMKYWYSRKYLKDEFTEEQCSQIKDMK